MSQGLRTYATCTVLLATVRSHAQQTNTAHTIGLAAQLADTHNFFAREDDIMNVLRPSLIQAQGKITDEELSKYDQYWAEF